jgi:integrase/recombinase XerD
MSDKPISPLRGRMIEDMTVRNFVEKTRNDYIRHVRTFTTFLGRAPDTAAPEDPLRCGIIYNIHIGGTSELHKKVTAVFNHIDYQSFHSL